MRNFKHRRLAVSEYLPLCPGQVQVQGQGQGLHVQGRGHKFLVLVLVLESQVLDNNTGCYCSRVVCCLVNSVMVTYNAALNRPAYQSSVHRNSYGIFPAHLANDGNSKSANYVDLVDYVPQCSHSEIDTNPWWAVDLGRPTTVYRVDLTNAKSNYGK